MKYPIIIVLFLLMMQSSCNNIQEQKKQSEQEILQNNIDSLIKNAAKGDLIVRLNDDLISEQVKQMNEADKSYSHAGIILERNNQKFVCHIMPDLPGADTILITPIDSFINPVKNIKCGLYRYDITSAEKDSLQTALLEYKQQNILFDKVYDLKSNDSLYCSEMIAKSLDKATKGRIKIKDIKIPDRLKRMVEMYFSKYKNSKEIVAARTYYSIDNLYLVPSCKLLMKFDLKVFPGK